MPEKTFAAFVPRCPRCKGSHGNMTVQLFTNAPDNFVGWALCPALNEPILFRSPLVKVPNELLSSWDAVKLLLQEQEPAPEKRGACRGN